MPGLAASGPTILATEGSNSTPSGWSVPLKQYRYIPFWGVRNGTGSIPAAVRQPQNVYCGQQDAGLLFSGYQSLNDSFSFWGAYSNAYFTPSPVVYAFATDAPIFGLCMQLSSVAPVILCDQDDGKGWQVLGTGRISGSNQWVVLNWAGVRKPRRYMLHMGPSAATAVGAAISKFDSWAPLKMDGEIRISVTQDSYGGYHEQLGTTMMSRLAMSLGTPNFVADCIGGTGYRVNGGQTYGKAIDRVPLTLVPAFAGGPDIHCCFLGLNDGGAADSRTDVLAYWAAVRAAFPNALLVAFDPFSAATGASGITTLYTNVSRYFEEAMQAAGGSWACIHTMQGTYTTSWGASGVLTGEALQTGDGRQVNTTAALTAATSATLTANWTKSSGTYQCLFDDETIKPVTLTQNATSMTWTGAVTTTGTRVGVYSSVPGNSVKYIGDGTHPYPLEGATYLAESCTRWLWEVLRTMP